MKQMLIFGILFLIISASYSLADVPETMSYQGKLTNSDGTTVADGDYKLAFRLYDTETGDTELWWESQTVEVNNGIFSVILGSVTPLSSTSLSFATQYWLSIQISGGGELAPRTQLTSAPYALGGNFWRLNGNAGTNAGTNFLGTTDYQPLELHVNGTRALRLEYRTYYSDEETVNVIAGYSGNSVGGAVGATIAGGGGTDHTNRATENYATVGGGRDNEASSSWATVCGGLSNTASGQESVICGGRNNVADSLWATIGGGRHNEVTAYFGTIAGGGAQVESYGNRVTGGSGTIGGGTSNKVFDRYGTIGGGLGNETGDDDGDETEYSYATVAGGEENWATGLYSAIPGGNSNEAGGDYSFAAGRRAKIHGNGSFMWADSTNAEFYRTTSNRFYVRSSNGVFLYTSGDLSSGSYLGAGGTSWNTLSDRASKRNIRQVNSKEILARLMQVPISQWSYKTQDSSIEHIGPMAQDFYSAFGLGADDKHINTIDPDGVALAAIQGLYELVKEKDARIADLEARLAILEAAVLSAGD